MADIVEVIISQPQVVVTAGGPNLAPYATLDFVNGVSGSLAAQITVSNAGVASLNSLSGALNLLGSGNITITSNGQNITISGAEGGGTINLSGYLTTGNGDLRYYPLTANPSGYVIGSSTGQFATANNLGLTGSNLQAQITNLITQSGNLTGQFYPLNSNPSGYINNTGGLINSFALKSETGVFALNSNLISTGNSLQVQINSVNSNTGQFVTNSQSGGLINAFYPRVNNPAGYLVAADTGILTGVFVLASSTGVYATFNNLSLTGANLQTQINTLNTNTGLLTGLFVTRGETGVYSTYNQLTGVSGFLASLISASTAGVGSINGLSGSLTLVGLTGIQVFGAGQTINIGTTGVVLRSETGSYATAQNLNNTGAQLKNLINLNAGFFAPRQLFVDPISGSNLSGLREWRNRPFFNLSGAMNAALSGDLIRAYPGVYYERLPLKNYVDLDLMGVTLRHTGDGETLSDTDMSKAIINDSAGPVNCRIFGKPNIENLGSDVVDAYFICIGISNTGSNIYGEFGNLISYASGVNPLSIGIRFVAGRFVGTCQSILTNTYDCIWVGLFNDESVNTTNSYFQATVLEDIIGGDQAIEYGRTNTDAEIYVNHVRKLSPLAGVPAISFGQDGAYTGQLKIFANTISHYDKSTPYSAINLGNGNITIDCNEIYGFVELGGIGSTGIRRINNATMFGPSGIAPLQKSSLTASVDLTNCKLVTTGVNSVVGTNFTGLRCFNSYATKDIAAGVTQIIPGGLIIEELTR